MNNVCGRFALATDKSVLEMLFSLDMQLACEPRYNITPSQKVIAVRNNPQSGNKQFVLLKWGLVPFWAEDLSIGAKMINARSETVVQKPSFREAFRKRRLVIPGSGFFEWKKEGSIKQPYYICRKDGLPLIMAGLWERWAREEPVLETCTILTTESNDYLKPIHNRMPVLLSRSTYPLWLDEQVEMQELIGLMKPYPQEELLAYPVTQKVNSPANDNPELIEEKKG